MRIQVYDSPLLENVIAEFDSIEELFKYAEENSTGADSVVIDNMVMLGWDEVYDLTIKFNR